jgi:type VI secretion system protein ImpK
MPTLREDVDRTDWETGPGGSKSLLEISSDAVLLIFHIHGGNDPGHPEDLRKSIALLLQNIDREAKRYGHSEEDVKATRYALCALIDETILNSRWSFKDQWAERPLQLEYFGEHMAGERFFDLLERVRQKGRRKADLLEVFCMCLILGFQGKYKLHGRDELAKLTHGLVEEANEHQGSLSGLSPHWKVPDETVERQVSTIPRWALVTGIVSVVAVILVFIVFKLWLNSAATEAVRRMIL